MNAMHQICTLAPELRRALRADKAAWIAELAQDAERAADKADQRTLYKLVRRLTARPMAQPKRLMAKDGTCVATTADAAK
eukprot:4593549-Alexandrium_andersonii.AAC.1